MPPPEFHPPRWRTSIERLKKEKISIIAPTHFGKFEDVDWHLDAVLSELDVTEQWMAKVMPNNLGIEELRKEFAALTKERSLTLGVKESILNSLEKANPPGMAADGMQRYWDKYINKQ